MAAWRESGPGALGFAGAKDDAMGEISSEVFWLSRLRSQRVHIVVAEEGSEIVGFASTRESLEGELELSGVVVLEGRTGMGIGTRLLRKALEGARKRGYPAVTVKTEKKNERAIGFYKKVGFVESHRKVERLGTAKVEVQVLKKRLR